MEISGKNLAMAGVILALLILVIIFYVRSETTAARELEAKDLSATLSSFLTKQNYHQIFPICRDATPGNYHAQQACLDSIVAERDLSGYFRESRFQNVDLKDKEDGYIIILNDKGDRVFESAKFTLNLNNARIATGCATPGEIDPGFTCRLDFSKQCAPGDNLEVLYDGKRAHLKTC